MPLSIRYVPSETRLDPKEVLSRPLGFCRHFCDRMFTMKWNGEKGWHDATIGPYQHLSLDPAAIVLHYAQEIFEGLKAYYRVDGSIGMFRPDRNAERMNVSAKRLVMPEIPVSMQMDAYEAIVRELKDFVPTKEGYSLYLRPTMIGVTPVLGVQPARDYLYYIICSPVSGYFEKGFEPVRVATSGDMIRAAVGGLGAAKTGGNYAASLLATKMAKDQGFDQVVWLDAKEHALAEEMGGMNIFFVYGNTLRTCPLTGSILGGITRDSIFDLAPELGLEARDEAVDVNQALLDIESGKLTEIFACGTAAIVTAVSEFSHQGKTVRVGDGRPGAVTRRLYETLLGIQTGRLPDPRGWRHSVVS